MYASGLARWSRGTVWVVHVLLPRHSPMLRALLCALYTLPLLLLLSFSLVYLFSIRHSVSSFEFLQIFLTTVPPFDQIIFKTHALNELHRFKFHLSYTCNIKSFVWEGWKQYENKQAIGLLVKEIPWAPMMIVDDSQWHFVASFKMNRIARSSIIYVWMFRLYEYRRDNASRITNRSQPLYRSYDLVSLNTRYAHNTFAVVNVRYVSNWWFPLLTNRYLFSRYLVQLRFVAARTHVFCQFTWTHVRFASQWA